MEMCGASDRRYINQLHSFKHEVRNELNFMNKDISKLFQSFESVKEMIGTNISANLQRQEGAENFCTMHAGKDLPVKDCARENVFLLNAFESEKKLNRELHSHVQALEDTVFRISKDMAKFISFVENINETVKEIVSNISIERGDSYKYDNGIDDGMDVDKAASNNRFEEKEDHEYIDHGAVIQNITTKAIETTTTTLPRQSCLNVPSSGVYDIYLETLNSVKPVYCDAETDEGDWIVIMRRKDGTGDFDRHWDDYKNGFGNLDGEFWIGNAILHELSNSKPMQLRVDMTDFGGYKVFAKYARFQIGSEADKFSLSVSGYSGTAGDSLTSASKESYKHDGMKFSTRDSDNDKSYTSSCAKLFSAGWWFNSCFESFLTGKYSHMSSVKRWNGIIWNSWTGMEKSLKFVEMKIR